MVLGVTGSEKGDVSLGGYQEGLQVQTPYEGLVRVLLSAVYIVLCLWCPVGGC